MPSIAIIYLLHFFLSVGGINLDYHMNNFKSEYKDKISIMIYEGNYS